MTVRVILNQKDCPCVTFDDVECVNSFGSLTVLEFSKESVWYKKFNKANVSYLSSQVKHFKIIPK